MTRREVWACTALCAGKRCEKRAIVPCAGEKIDNEGLPISCVAEMSCFHSARHGAGGHQRY